MNYLLKNKPKTKYNSKAIIIGVFFCVLLLLSFLFPNFFKSISRNSAKPVFAIKNFSFKVSYYVVDFFKLRNNLIKENKRLEEEVALLNLVKVDYDVLIKENESLKKELGLNINKNRISAEVISKPPQSAFDTILINKGSSSSIVVGSNVYVSDSILLGKIDSVTSNTGLVKLFSSSKEKTEVVLTRTGATFVLEGNGGSNFVLEIPKETDVLWGDTFTLSGRPESIVATVYYVDTNSQSSFKNIYAKIPVNLGEINSVFIEK